MNGARAEDMAAADAWTPRRVVGRLRGLVGLARRAAGACAPRRRREPAAPVDFDDVSDDEPSARGRCHLPRADPRRGGVLGRRAHQFHTACVARQRRTTARRGAARQCCGRSAARSADAVSGVAAAAARGAATDGRDG